ncbi:MAG: hypothetical protein LBR26_02655 [Prevotella sp.]|jgi:hypothetical protein|nr:hypothetical protein [Prevotella sp.]
MKRSFVILVLALSISFAANAASLCGSGLKYEFSGGDRGTVVLTTSGGTLKGTYLVDHKNNIRIAWDTGYSEKLIFVSDGVFSVGDITLRECK